MQTTIKQVTPVEYDLEIDVSAADLEPEFKRVLKQQRAQTRLKGFRPGKVPLSVVKKMYGKALAYGIAEKSIQDTYESEVMKPGDHEVLGQPKITELEYEMDGDLHAVVRFGVRPSFELASLEGEELSRLSHEVTDEDIEEEITRLLSQDAELVPSDAPVGATDFVVVDLQQLDDESKTPIIGKKEEGVTFHLGDQRVRDRFRDALVGQSVGATVRVEMPHGEDDGHTHTYDVTLKEVKSQALPELDAEFVSTVTKGRIKDVDAFRAEIATELSKAWSRRTEDLQESMVVERIVEFNPIEIPASVIDLYLDAFVEDLKKQVEGSLPEHFDEQAFREDRRSEAERQSRWMLIRDYVIEKEGVEVTEADREAYYSESAGEDVSVELMKQYYSSVPGLVERLNHRLLTKKVMDHFKGQFSWVDKNREAFEEERKAKLEAMRDKDEDEEPGRFSKWTMPIKRAWNQLRKP